MIAVLPAIPSRADVDSTDRLDEVVVTARKREENLQDVPVSIAAYGAEQLKAQSLVALSDIGLVTPNFFYAQEVQSGSSAGQLYIRGVGQHDTQATFNPSVGLYVDGVYISRAQADDLDMTDVERLEVLYGPQGTLFGKNTNGGAVNVMTFKPDPSVSAPNGWVELQGGDFNRFDAAARLNLPLATDVAALALSGSRRSQEGYSVRTDGEQQANQNTSPARAQLLVKLADNVEAIIRVDETNIDEHSAAYRLVEVRTSSTVPVLYATYTPYRYDDRWVTASSFSYAGTGPNKNSGTVGGASATLSWTASWGTLKSVSAFRQLNIESDFDPDGSPLAVLSVFNRVRQHQVSEELQGTGVTMDGRLHWLTGLYYFREIAQDDQPAIVAKEYFDGDANFDPELHVINQNYAGYGQATLAITHQLKLSLGGRLGNDQAEVGRVELSYPVPTVEQPYVSRSASWNSFLPRVELAFHGTPDLMTYVSAAEGTKSGGFNGRAGSIAEFNGFGPEKVWTYEVGLRSDWLDQRLRLNATAYYSLYTDFQITLNRSVTDPATGQPVAYSFVANMPKAAIRGGELALTAVPVANLKLTEGLGLTDGRYIDVLPGAPVTTRTQFVDAPRVTFTSGAEYTAALGDSIQLTARLDYVHKTTIQYDYGNSPLVAQSPFGLLNGRLILRMPQSGFSSFLFATNITDAHYAIGGLDDGPSGSLGEVIKLMGAPREWGMGAEYRF